MPTEPESLIYRLRKRAEIRRQASTRKSVQEGKPDRLADLLEEAANEIEGLHALEIDRKHLVLMKELVTAYALLKQADVELAWHQFTSESPACVNCGGESDFDVGRKCPCADNYDLSMRIQDFLANVCLAYNAK